MKCIVLLDETGAQKVKYYNNKRGKKNPHLITFTLFQYMSLIQNTVQRLKQVIYVCTFVLHRRKSDEKQKARVEWQNKIYSLSNTGLMTIRSKKKEKKKDQAQKYSAVRLSMRQIFKGLHCHHLPFVLQTIPWFNLLTTIISSPGKRFEFSKRGHFKNATLLHRKQGICCSTASALHAKFSNSPPLKGDQNHCLNVA